MSIEEELLKPRIICCEDYLNNKFEVGKQIPLVWKKEFNDWEYEDCSTEILLSTFLKYKQFKKLEWWEERTIEELKSVKFVKVTYYTSYWHEGEIVPVTTFFCDNEKMRYGYDLKYGHFHPFCYVEPATEEEYNCK